jgi:outer membrane receptor protein involved in Fe transport
MYFHSERESELSKYVPGTDISAGDPWENEQVYDIGQINYTYDHLRVLLYGQGRKWEYVNPSGKQKGRYYGVDIQDKWNFWKMSVTAGGNYDHEKSSRISGDFWVDNDRNKGALFFLAETDLAAETELILGAREVFSSESDNIFCPQFQVLQRMGEKNSLYLNVNRSLREPNLSQIYGYSATQLPNEDLKYEVGWTYEVGFKKRISGSDQLKLSLYHMKIDDRIYRSRTETGETIYLNASKFKNTGVELSYEHNVSESLSFGTGISYMDPKQKAGENDEWEETEHKFGLNMNVGYRLGNAMVNLMARHCSERAEDTDPLWDVTLNASYNVTDKDTFRLNVNNLLDRDDHISSGGGSLLEEQNFLFTYERTF